ncbi:unnamed protein product [Enterobius vermicularis]|uniref:Peptidase S1 domain-containing protein n=1 Tax=Enterobius vermicularis TaxID=51028 RepID=A0A0N4VHG9_ENTVE|nr:unnamed protein product [Enterobius vermicularis]
MIFWDFNVPVISLIVLQLQFISLAKCCSFGLTQLRYSSLALMYCDPPKKDEPDPCQAVVGVGEAFCQLDGQDGKYVCCGSPRASSDPDPKLYPIQQSMKVVSPNTSTGRSAVFSNTTTAVPTKSFAYTEKNQADLSASALLPSHFINTDLNTTQLTDLDFSPRSLNETDDQPLNYTLFLGPVLTPFLAKYTNEKAKEWFGLPTADRNFSKYNGTSTPKERLNVVLANGTKIYSRLMPEDDGPLLTLVTGAQYHPGNVTNTWTATSSVVLLQDGPCSVVVNTGLPVQKNEIIANLASKGIIGNKLDYTVITSGLPQFVGNVNLFPASQFIIGLFYAHWTTVAFANVRKIPFVDLCSSKTQIMHTPGPSPDAITVVARNVPSMGTVAITGALFVQDIDPNRIEEHFVWNEEELLMSRKKVICMSDWIIPAHAAPSPVTKFMKRQMECF